MLQREAIANRPKHWVRLVTACNSRCLFCLDADTPRNVYLDAAEIEAELRRGRDVLGADKVILSGGEATLHPQFPAFVRQARAMGYERVQTVTNGWKFAERAFYRACMDAGLGEITFSLHGHTAELHDHMTQTQGAFARLMKGMLRALRDPDGPIVNVDVVINKQNVAVLDKIIELSVQAGVTEFDLLHVIPQANAYDNRDELFYDPTEHLPTLHKVFRLNRHPRFVIWTNRFPVEFLEGLEDLIQDPHKMLDEVNGRRFMVRSYLDVGKPLECRDPKRCVHCFIEPFCETMDRTLAAHREEQVEVWEVGPGDLPVAGPLPLGCTRVGLRVPDLAAAALLLPELPAGVSLELRVERVGPWPDGLPPTRLVLDSSALLDGYLLRALPDNHEVVVELNDDTCSWLLAHRPTVSALGPRLRLHQPSHEHLRGAANDVRDPSAFFRALALPVRASGLAACEAPGAQLEDPPLRAGPVLFDPLTGRIDIQPLAHDHVAQHYKAKSLRCRSCPVDTRCDGIAINRVRDQGLRLCQPLTGDWADEALQQLSLRWPTPRLRVRDGRPLEAPPPSLPGFAEPTGPTLDPLGVIATEQRLRREARRRELGLPDKAEKAPGTAPVLAR